MTKYLLLKHYRGDHEIAPGGLVPMDQWTPAEIEAHMSFMGRVTDDFVRRGEFVDAQGLSPDGVFVRYDGEGKPPVTDGPFAETKDLICGFDVLDCADLDQAIEVAGKHPMAWAGAIELRPFWPDEDE